MIRKKTLLIAFFLSLFILQQTQVSAKFLPCKKEVLQVSSGSANSLPSQRNIYMIHLMDPSGLPDLDESDRTQPCTTGDTAYGCAELGSGDAAFEPGNECKSMERGVCECGSLLAGHSRWIKPDSQHHFHKSPTRHNRQTPKQWRVG